MAFKLGQTVIWTDMSSDHLVLRTGVVTKLNSKGAEIWVDHAHKPEDCLYAAFAFPDVVPCRELLEDTIALRARHDKESKDLLTRTLQVANEMVRQGLK